MKSKILLYSSLLFFVAIVFTATNAFSQNVITIERSRIIENINVNGESIRKLYDARLSTGNVTLVCDSAWQFIDRNEIRAFGNIQIDTQTEHIWTDTLYYYTDKELSELRGRVIIKQDSTLLFGNKVDYNFLTKEAFFLDNIRLEDTQGTLVAQSGIYYQRQDSAEFRGNVQLTDSAKYAESDSLFLNRKKKLTRLFGDIFVADSINNSILKGNYLEADSSGRRYIDGNAYLRRISEDTTDTTHIFADEILLQEKDSTTFIDAYTQVKVWSEKFSSISDTLLYNSKDELFQLREEPKAWHKQIQLTGPYIFVQLDSSKVKQLTSYYETIAVQEDSTTGRLNQIKGDTLVADFSNGDISQIMVYPNSEILYHTKGSDGKPDGAMENTSPKTILSFENGALIRAWMGKNQGLFLPEYTDLVNRRLDGFIWTPELRPVRPVTNSAPKHEPIPIERPFKLPKRFTYNK